MRTNRKVVTLFQARQYRVLELGRSDAWAAGGVRDGSSAECCSVAPPSSGAAGRRWEPSSPSRHDTCFIRSTKSWSNCKPKSFLPIPRLSGRSGRTQNVSVSAPWKASGRLRPRVLWLTSATGTLSERKAVCRLGLVPRQHSSGGKTQLLGISKRGDPHLRTLLVYGARSVAIVPRQKPTVAVADGDKGRELSLPDDTQR
jgi:hypothetical protein